MEATPEESERENCTETTNKSLNTADFVSKDIHKDQGLTYLVIFCEQYHFQ